MNFSKGKILLSLHFNHVKACFYVNKTEISKFKVHDNIS